MNACLQTGGQVSSASPCDPHLGHCKLGLSPLEMGKSGSHSPVSLKPHLSAPAQPLAPGSVRMKTQTLAFFSCAVVFGSPFFF